MTGFIDEARLREMLRSAAEEGARIALERVGLGDEEAQRDIIEGRGLVQSLRNMKMEAYKAFAQWLTIFILGAIALSIGLKIVPMINPK